MNNKITAMALAACMSFSLVPNAFAANDPIFTLYNIGSRWAEPGDEVTYKVKLEDAENIMQLGATLTFDTDIFEYVKAEKCMDYSYTTANNMISKYVENGVLASLTFSGTYDVTDADIFYVTLKVKDDVVSGFYPEAVTLESGSVTYDNGTYIPTNCDTWNQVGYLHVINAAPLTISPESTSAMCGEEVECVISLPEEITADALSLCLDIPDSLEFVNCESLAEGVNYTYTDGKEFTWLSLDGEKTLSGDLAKVKFKTVKTGRAELWLSDYSSYTVKGGADDIRFDIQNSLVQVNIAGKMNIDAVTDKREIKKGENVHVTVSTKNADALQGVDFILSYDNTMFKLTEPPKDNFVPTVIGTAVCKEEGRIAYTYMGTSEENFINGEQTFMELDLIATGNGNGSIVFEDAGTYPEYIGEFTDADITIISQDDEDVKNAVALIDVIPDITAENYNAEEVAAAVAAADAAVSSLSDEKQALVGNKERLEKIRKTIESITKAKAVMEALDAITVTDENYDSEVPDAIKAVKTAYEALTEEEKAIIPEYDDKLQAVNDALNAINAEKAKPVKDALAALNVSAENYKTVPDEIKMIEDAYVALTNTQKILIPEYTDRITAAKTAVEDYTAAAGVSDMIDKLDINSDSFKANAEAVKAAYDKLTDTQKSYVKNYTDYEKKLADYAAMKDILVTVQKVGNTGYIINAKERKPIEKHQTVIAAVYAENGTLVMTAVLSSDNGEAVVKCGANESIKSFVWDSLEGMKPYDSVETINK